MAATNEIALDMESPIASYGREVDIAELVDRLKAGAPDAGPSLVSLCGARLVQYAHLVAPQLSDADNDDVCERAVEHAVERIELYNVTRGSFEAWLRGFVRREIYELLRRASSIAVANDQLEHLAVSIAADRYLEPSGQASALKDLAPKLYLLIESLSETDQLMLELRDYERLPYSSIAERLGVSESACRQRYFRALARLRQMSQQHPEFANLWGES
jgi:RNA polymerase sigma factor (sigma-70 family)